MHRDFPLDPKTGTTSLIFHFLFLSMLQYIFIHAEASNTMDRKPSRPIPWTENHRVQYHGQKTIASKKSCAKIMRRTIGGSAQPNIGSKTKIFRGAALDPIKWGYGCPSNPLLTMWKEYNTTQQKFKLQCYHFIF